ncbi:hypothetical protein Celaphus_00014922 [Cervus elaphus hippelaphus]|uniref:Uncharacterized protein n=1 Tax=Cervus elaphus hippelaphus TaxID=46360 RepID=A0A212D408_CEREH|nr:hypothetical protein Celaphus_00014922 [Cervus elaphus hippelaphus]
MKEEGKLQGQRHLEPPSERAESRQRQWKSTGQRHRGRQGSLASFPAPSPHPMTFPGLDPPSYRRAWQMGSPRSAGRWRPRNTTMTAGTTGVVPYADLSRTPCDAFFARTQR